MYSRNCAPCGLHNTLKGERDEWDVVISAECMCMTTIVNIRAVVL